MRYFFNVVPNRNYNPFHLVDMYIKIGGVIPNRKGLFFEVIKESEEKALLFLKKEGILEDDMLIGLHLGASKSDKTWPVKSYAALADLMYQAFSAKILVFGSPSEADLAEEFKILTNAPHMNLVGKTNLERLASLLKKCTLFITNDTGPLHIATAVHTKVIDISTANVHFMETGPYGEGHYVIQADLPCVPCGFDVKCNDMKCKSIITPDAVFEVVKDAIKGKCLDYKPDSRIWRDIQVYKSHFKDDGLLGFYPLIRRPLRKDILYRILYRHVWNMGFNPVNEKMNTAFEKICDEISSYYTLDLIHEIISSIRKEIDALLKLTRLAEEGLNLPCQSYCRRVW